jgi:hypothetical protein
MNSPQPDARRSAIDARILEWMREPGARSDEARFDELARALFGFQVEHCEPYRRFAEGRGVTPATIDSWHEIPAVPTGAFKELALHSFPAEAIHHRFRTSGTSTDSRGTLYLDTLELYEASLLPTFRRFIFPDLPDGGRTTVRILAPSNDEAPESSLSHMFGVVIDAFGDQYSGFDIADNELLAEGLCSVLEDRAAAGRPVTLCGTAFSFVHLLDEMERRRVQYRLPDGSRLMECGGFKGRSRELRRPDLYAALEDALGIPIERMINQYGMTELGSQFYDSVLVDSDTLRHKEGPPWARVSLVDPLSGSAVKEGETGQIVIHDLANTGSILAVQTADLGRAVAGGFEVIGREPGAEARGCSIAADEMLAG